MRLILLHLSDIHIKTDEDAVLDRAEHIVSAARSVEHEADGAIIVVSGDVAFSGKEDQFTLGANLIETVKRGLAEHLGAERPVWVVAVPGNHDCDFGGPGGAREIIADQILSRTDQVRDASVVNVCTDVQRAFFEFLELVAAEGRSPAGNYSDRLYWEYRFDLRGQPILFRCCNTAWLSRLRENQGDLYFPADALPDGDSHAPEDGLVVTVFHHPYNWIEANAAPPSESMLKPTFRTPKFA